MRSFMPSFKAVLKTWSFTPINAGRLYFMSRMNCVMTGMLSNSWAPRMVKTDG